MESTLTHNYQPFIAAFVCCTLDPDLQHPFYAPTSHLYFITDIKLVYPHTQPPDPYTDHIDLGANYRLLISRNPCHLPVIDVANFQQVPQGWQPIIIDQQISKLFKSVPCLKRGSLVENGKCLYSLQIFDEIQEEKEDFLNQATQPSLTYKSELINNYLQFRTQNLKKYINFSKRSQLEIQNIRFKPKTQSIYENRRDEIDIPNLAIMCFPEGVKIRTKQSGFKFFSFILTNDSAQRFYCNSISFYQKCPQPIQTAITQKYGPTPKKHLYTQKTLTLITHHSCTDNTKKYLQHLYRIYLSKPSSTFLQQSHKICSNFKIDKKTHYASLTTQDYNIRFKINTSYPQTSNHAIYAIFKFLSIQNIVTVVENLLLERKMFFISRCQNLVGMAIQGFLGLIYPLNWVHGIINPLSSSMIQYKDAPMTVIFGISSQLTHKLDSNTDCLLIDLDNNKLTNKITHPQQKSLSLYVPLRKQLISRLKQYNVYDEIDIRDYLNNTQNLSLFKTQQTQDPHFDPYKIRNIFFQLTVFILRNYGDYFIVREENGGGKGREKARGFKKYYHLDGLLYLNRKDPFLTAFFKTSLFSVLIQKKYEQPNNKWIKTLDKAIRKISSYNKQFIQQESDNLSDTNQPEQKQPHLMPKGCLNMISMISRSDEQQSQKSSPSPKRRKLKTSKQFEQQKNQNNPRNTRNLGRMSLPNQYQKRHQSILDSNKYLMKKGSAEEKRRGSDLVQVDADTEKEDKQTDKGSESCGKSDSTPQLKQNREIIVYEFEMDKQEKQDKQGQHQGVAHLICSFFSYPYKKVSNSVVSRWTKRKLDKLKSWKHKAQKNQNADIVQMAVQGRPHWPSRQQKNIQQ